jgi:hypothetical protein
MYIFFLLPYIPNTYVPYYMFFVRGIISVNYGSRIKYYYIAAANYPNCEEENKKINDP